MKILCVRSQLYILRLSNPSCSPSDPPLFLKPIKILSHGKQFKHPATSIAPSKSAIIVRDKTPTTLIIVKKHSIEEPAPRSQKTLMKLQVPEDGYSRFVIMGAVSLGILLVLSGIDDQKALALGPEGPLVEEFWDNVRRYALYALTVSTGALYTILLPIVELLKNPISAILVLAIFGGSIYLVSQVLSAMVGVTDFTYDYEY